MPFSGYAEVVESKSYVHPDGRSVSLFSAHVPAGFVLTPKGWDIAWTGDGTVGRCKAPFATREEAETFAGDWNGKRVLAYVRANKEAPDLPKGAPYTPQNEDEI